MFRFYALAISVGLLDQLSKWLVVTHMRLGEVIELAAFINLRHSENRGAAFSFLADASGWQRLFLSTVAAAISIWIVFVLRRGPPALEALALSLVLGGALGNLADRLFRGHVVDMLDFHWAGYHWPTFNVADIGIVLGVAILLLHSIRTRDTAANAKA